MTKDRDKSWSSERVAATTSLPSGQSHFSSQHLLEHDNNNDDKKNNSRFCVGSGVNPHVDAIR